MNKLSKFSQENVIALLCWDEANCSMVRAIVSPDLFDVPYSNIVRHCIRYWDDYKQPIGDHIADELEADLAGPNGEKFREVLLALFTIKDHFSQFNGKYVLEKVVEFVRGQKFTEALYNAATLHSQGKLDEAQNIINRASEFNIASFDPGIRLTDTAALRHSLDDDGLIPTGIKALEDMKVGPARGQLFIYLGVKSSGKSWFCIQAAKMAMLMGLKVAHITMEISRDITLQRYIQAFLSISRWEYETILAPRMEFDSFGKYKDIVVRPVKEVRSMDDPDIIEYIERKLAAMGPRIAETLFIKDFPPGTLTLAGLEGYLDSLERGHNFIPDVVIVDMPRNMKIDMNQFRLSMDQLFIDLRGLAVKRNTAVIAPHQINRAGAQAGFITGEHVSEDWGILGTADTAVIYNQKPWEKNKNIARLWVDRARSMRSQFTILMTQCYDLGQYCLESIQLPSSYATGDPNKEKPKATATKKPLVLIHQ